MTVREVLMAPLKHVALVLVFLKFYQKSLNSLSSIRPNASEMQHAWIMNLTLASKMVGMHPTTGRCSLGEDCFCPAFVLQASHAPSKSASSNAEMEAIVENWTVVEDDPRVIDAESN